MKNKNNFSEKIWPKLLPYAVILIVTYLMIAFQLRAHATFLTSDRFLHFSRFYDTMMQIKTGNYSYFQMNYGFNQCGRVFNAVYGPFFAYLNGLLLLICHTWFNYEIVVTFIVNLLGGMGMYRLSKKVHINEFFAILFAVLYLQFGILLGFLRANNFMGWGAALAPYILMQAIGMMTDRERPIHWLTLAFWMSLIAQIHLLSTLVIALTLVPFAIYGWVKTNRKKQMLLDLAKAVGMTLLLTANVWGGLLYLSLTNPLASPESFHLCAHAISVPLKNAVYQHGNISLLFLILILLQFVYILRHFKDSAVNSLATIWSLILILFASSLLPWAKIQEVLPVLGRNFQFPYRLALGAFPLILMAMGMTCTKIVASGSVVKRNWLIFVILLTIMQFFGNEVGINAYYTSMYQNPKEVIVMSHFYTMTKERKQFYHVLEETNSGKLFALMSHVEPDYLPTKANDAAEIYGRQIVKQRKQFKHTVSGSKLILTWNSLSAKKMTLPLVMYKQSQLTVNGQNRSKTKKNKIGQPIIIAQKGKNTAVLTFKTATWFLVLLMITILSWLFLLFVFIKRKFIVD